MKSLRDLAAPGRADLLELVKAMRIVICAKGARDPVMIEHRLVVVAEQALTRGQIEGLDRALEIFNPKVAA